MPSDLRSGRLLSSGIWETDGGAVRVVVGFQLFVYVVCHVQYPVDVGDGESFAGKLLFAGHSPETVGQVVVFHRAMLLYGAIAAVVVGQYQAFGRDDFAGTATAEMHHGILQAMPSDCRFIGGG